MVALVALGYLIMILTPSAIGLFALLITLIVRLIFSRKSDKVKVVTKWMMIVFAVVTLAPIVYLAGYLIKAKIEYTIAEKNRPTITADVIHDEKYNAATVAISPEDFEKAGFVLGDSCNIEFSNGYTISDVPFYNGYYVKNGDPVIVAYPGFTNVSITYNNMGIWDQAELTEDTTVTITRYLEGRFRATQDALGQVYSFERKDYTTDEEFCNFRAMTGGNLKKDFFYRGASTVDNSRGRAPYTDGLLKEHKIGFIVDLADSEENMQKYLADKTFASNYTKSLYENNQVALLSMSSSFQSEAYKAKVCEGMKQMMTSEGPVYIHCMEGKDRTGFVCTLLEALAGASYEEMCADYMKTYDNYYDVTKTETSDKYDAIKELYFDTFIDYLHGTISDKTDADYTEDAIRYLMEGGMTREEVIELQQMITE